MIRFRNVWKTYRLGAGERKPILSGLTLDLPHRRRVAVIGRNGAGKSTLLRMIGGSIRPDRGRIESDGRVSWPMGFGGGFHPALTGRQNARFVARIYGADTDHLIDYVEEFAELGAFLDQPFEKYSQGMRARLAFGVSMAAEFDPYLVDEITAVGDAVFRRKCRAVFEEKLQDAVVTFYENSSAAFAGLRNNEIDLYIHDAPTSW